MGYSRMEEGIVGQLRRLMDARGYKQKGLAAAAGLNDTAIRDILTGRSRDPKVSTVAKIAEILGPDVYRLFFGISVGQSRQVDDEFLMVPEYGVRLSAGDGAVQADSMEPIRMMAFRMDWIRSRTSAPADRLGVMSVAGISMEPELRHGDSVLVDMTVRHVSRDGMYAISYHHSDEVMIKHIKRDPRDHTITIISANPVYGETAGVSDDDLIVWGRVIWVGRNVG